MAASDSTQKEGDVGGAAGAERLSVGAIDGANVGSGIERYVASGGQGFKKLGGDEGGHVRFSIRSGTFFYKFVS